MSPTSAHFRPRRRNRNPRQAASAVRETNHVPPTYALLVVDQTRLQRVAWADYLKAQRQHEKAARDLHRHEEIDTPAYEQWLNQTFPVQLTDLRNLQEEVTTKAGKIRFIRALAAHTGRSAKRLWQELKENEARAENGDFDFADADEARKSGNHRAGDDDDFFADRDDDEPPYRGRGQSAAQRVRTVVPPARSREARDVYRRLVQRLHPDRGGEWTASRKRLWHEVQQAWDKGDADWLARLEVELESATDLHVLGLDDVNPLTVNSPLSRLRRAMEELIAARRDTERKLRVYRTTPPWRFTLAEKKRAVLERRIERTLRADHLNLERQLAHLEKTIRGWEEPALGRTKPRYTAPDW